MTTAEIIEKRGLLSVNVTRDFFCEVWVIYILRVLGLTRRLISENI